MKHKAKRPGLTLVEMLVVIGILALLATVFGFAMTRLHVQSQVQAVERMFHLVDEALAVYRDERGAFPETMGIEDLYRELTSLPAAREILRRVEVNWGRAAVAVNAPPTEDSSVWPPVVDPWGQPFQYEWQADGSDTFPRLSSNGPDRRDGTDDDILNR